MTRNLSTYRRVLHSGLLAAIAIACLPVRILSAQQPAVPKFELFGGYSYVYPNSQLTGTLPGGVTPVSSCLCSIPRGAGVSATINLLPWLGLTADFSGNWAPHQALATNKISQSSFYSYTAGPMFTLHHGRFSPFAEALFGEQRLAPELFQSSSTFGMVAGAGVDIGLGRHIALRPIRADYLYSNHTFGANPSVASTNVRGMRLESGVVFTFGGAHAAAPAAMTAMAAPVVAAAIPAPIPAPALQPPTLTCSAMPSNMVVGDVSTITSAGNSPQGLPLTYSYAASSGVITGTSSTAMLATAGIAAGNIEINCYAVDSQGQKAAAITSVMVMPLAVAATPAAQSLCSISFARDTRRPVRVDNEAKACLDDIALTLQHQSDAILIITGSAGATEQRRNRRATQRAVNAKAYLVTDKGIDPARIKLYTDSQDSRTAGDVLVPAGATNNTDGRTPIDETAIGGPR